MTGSNNQSLVNSVSYGPANQLLQLNTSTFTETRSYNSNLQLTELASGAYHYKYNYSATQNNGRIQSMQDVASGETVAYSYDSLNRLTNASGTGDPTGSWSQSFSYDGFGNLTQKTGSNAPSNALLATNPLTNRLTGNGAGYDNNGNLNAYGTGSFAVSYSYDIENRMTTANREKFATYTRDSATGMDYAYQRYYMGMGSRYVTPDLSGAQIMPTSPQTWNYNLVVQTQAVCSLRSSADARRWNRRDYQMVVDRPSLDSHEPYFVE